MRQVDLVKEEEKTLKFWEERKIFEKTLEATKKGRPFVFFEGPPTANGRPGIHHVLARSFKDIICRFQTMRGRYVLRRAGWDTHGLPVEIEVEKKLGLKTKKDVEKFGVAKFNHECKKSVWQYKDEWEKLTRRMAFWLDLKKAYITYEPKYIESLWAIFKKISDKKLLIKDYKIVPFCVRCGTPISSHEVAQGYDTVTDTAVTIKFRVKGKPNTYLLAWTTTPWTLPGNVALAVGEKVVYQEVESDGEHFILAKDLVAKVFGNRSWQAVKNLKAAEVAGMAYEPLFQIKELQSPKSYKVYLTDFVNTEEGTGIVHTAVMYGVDDFELGTKLGLPKFHTVNREGEFIKSVPVVGGLSIIKDNAKDAITEKAVLLYLKKQNYLFAEAEYAHEYPFCWRCKSPLIYYALISWFIKMSAVRSQLVRNNKTINWVPEHLQTGRFGEWLREVKDWAISRERYWGTPLPIWECQKCERRLVAGSLADLNIYRADKPATLILLRHGEAVSNEKNVCSSYPETILNPLTDTGRKQVFAAVAKLRRELKGKKADAIYASDLLRTRETAQVIADELKIKNVVFDQRLRETSFGKFNSRPIKEYRECFNSFKERFIKPAPEGESLTEVMRRTKSLVKEVGQKYAGKTVIVVGHMDPLFTIQMSGGIYGDDETELAYQRALDKSSDSLRQAEYKTLTLNNWPTDTDGDLDLHRPFIDAIVLKCVGCQGKMERIKDLADVWFDSGAMPWARWHFPFENKKEFKQQFPADYISEGIDQTRGWFYTLLAVSTVLGEGAPYKNVISLNHVLDDKGEKMSKSKGNVVDPWSAGEKVGFDMLRWYFYSANGPGDNKLFNLKDIEAKKRRLADTLVNSCLFLETYYVKPPAALSPRSDILDKWILIRLNDTRAAVTTALDGYDITAAARTIEIFVDDLSNWYIRRSRRKFQQQKLNAEKLAAQETLEAALKNLSIIISPFMPFLAEWLYQNIKNLNPKSFLESVHLEKWPQPARTRLAKVKVKLPKIGQGTDVEKIMDKARGLVALGLAERARAGLRVRQPLNTLFVSVSDYNVIGDVIDIVAEELNVKKIIVDRKLTKDSVALDTNLTPELKEEGLVRELVRHINDMRKEARLTPEDKIILYYDIDYTNNTASRAGDFKELLVRWEEVIKTETRAGEIHFGITENDSFLIKKEWTHDGYDLKIGIKKI